MDQPEFLDWWEYYKVEPWGCEAEDQRVAVLRSGFAGWQPLEKLFPWTRQTYDAAVKVEDLEAKLDRFFDTHNDRVDDTTA